MQISHADIEDARAVAAIHVDAWRVAYASIVPAEYLAALSVDEREAMWRASIVRGIPELLVAKESGVVQGWLSFGSCRDEDAPKAQAEIWAIYVAPCAWSKGIGRLLWQRARVLIREHHFTTCCLWVFAQNERAITFYQSVGFAHDGAAPKSFELGGRQLQELRLVTQLDG